MKRAMVAASICACLFAGCNYGDVNNIVNEKPNTTAEVFDVIVGYMELNSSGNGASGTGETPTEACRRVLITPAFVLIENYNGYTKVIAMERLTTLVWKPNPDPPADPTRDEKDE